MHKKLLFEEQITQVEIAKKFEIPVQSIGAIKSGKTWKHVEYNPD